MTSPQPFSSGFVRRTAPLWALVDDVSDQLVLDAASRSRRARAWLRLGAVTTWLVVIIASGSSRWPWAVPWVVTVGLTVPHAYRNELKRYRTGRRRFDRFVGWLLPNYSATPGLNPVGVLDGIGCLIGGLVTGQLLGSRLNAVHAFHLDDSRQLVGAAAAYVLAAGGLAGGAAIVTAQVTWINLDVVASRKHRRIWLVLSTGLTLLVFALLWPGSPSHPAFTLRLVLDIAAALVIAFTCIYGRLDAERRVAATSELVAQVKWRVREGDSVHVHNAKRAANEIADDIRTSNNTQAAEPVDKLVVALARLQYDMEMDSEFEPQNATAIYADRLSTRGAKPTWTGVVADLDAATVLPVDAEFIKVAIDGLLSNAMAQDARNFELSLTARPNRPIGSLLVVEATCDCGVPFDGTRLDERSSLRRLARRLHGYRGDLSVEELGGGRHVCRFIWPTISYPEAST